MSQIEVERDGAVQRIAINRPEKKNALTADMYTALAEAIEQAEADPAVRVLLLYGKGDAFTAELFADADGHATLAVIRDRYMANLFADTLGFAGCKMIRRVLGLAHVEDLESITDPDTRATAESKVLAVGRKLILSRATMTKFGDILHLVEEIDT